MENKNYDNNKANYNYYYVTENQYLGTKDLPIVPQYNKTTIFEYGIGFYLTPDYEVAMSYAYSKSKKAPTFILGDKYSEENINTDFFNNLIDDIPEVNIYLHTFESKNDIINNKEYNIKIFESKNDYLQEIKKILTSYKNNEKINPNRDFSYGYIVGEYWDKYFEYKDSKNINIIEDLNYIKKFFDDPNIKIYRQFVIHKNEIKGEDFMVLFNHKREYISISEMEGRYSNG